jgi:hypothetical protein
MALSGDARASGQTGDDDSGDIICGPVERGELELKIAGC